MKHLTAAEVQDQIQDLGRTLPYVRTRLQILFVNPESVTLKLLRKSFDDLAEDRLIKKVVFGRKSGKPKKRALTQQGKQLLNFFFPKQKDGEEKKAA